MFQSYTQCLTVYHAFVEILLETIKAKNSGACTTENVPLKLFCQLVRNTEINKRSCMHHKNHMSMENMVLNLSIIYTNFKIKES